MNNEQSNVRPAPSAAVSAPDPPLPDGVHAWWRRLLLGGFLIAVTLAVYYPILSAGYDWDDNVHFRDNTFMRDGAGLKEMWLSPRQTANPIAYYPVTMSLFWVQCQIFGVARAAPFHGVSLALHIGNALLVWWVLRLLKLRWAWLAAMLFAIHPLQVETVAWASEQKNLLSALFYLLAAGTYLKFLDADATPKKGRRWGLYVLALGLFTLALLSKAVVVTLPAALLVVLWWKRRHLRGRDVLLLIPAGLVAGAISLLFFWVNLQLNSQDADVSLPVLARLVNAGHALWFYFGKLLWPVELLHIYPRWNIPGARWEYLYPCSVVALLVGLWGLRKKITTGPFTGALFFVLTLSPALGFISFSYLRYSFVADHFTYLANLGLLVLFVKLLRVATDRLKDWMRPTRRTISGLAPEVAWSAALLAVLIPLSWRASCLHADPIALWRYTVDRNSKSWMAQAVLASAYAEHHDYEPALRAALESATLRPNAPALEVAALVFQRQQNFEGACRIYQKLVDSGWAAPLDYVRYGVLLEQLRRSDLALPVFQAGVARDPRLVDGWSNLAACYVQSQQWVRGADAARRSLALREDYYDAHSNLAWALQHLGDLPGAIAHYRRALELNPESFGARLGLAGALQRSGKLPAAIAVYREAITMRPGSLEAHQELMQVLVQLGDQDGAQRERQTIEKLNLQKGSGQ